MGTPQIAPANRRARLLVCAFGPFPGVAVNPSEALARALVRLRRPALAGSEIRLLILPTRWASLALLDDTLARFCPDAVLLLGVASRRRIVELETRAANATRPAADAARRHPAGRVLVPGAPRALTTTARLSPLLAALRGQKVPARRSRDAGRYLCNAAYFHALAGLERPGEGGMPAPAVFVHLPGRSGRPAGVSAQCMARGLCALLVALAGQAGRARATPRRFAGGAPPLHKPTDLIE